LRSPLFESGALNHRNVVAASYRPLTVFLLPRSFVAASASVPAAMQYISAYSGVTMGEYFMDNGEDALIKLYEKSFDIVVSDVQMPRLDGFQLTERIKKEERFKDLPVILVTALQTDNSKERGDL
jgi:CheY-like chemotaxis protein